MTNRNDVIADLINLDLSSLGQLHLDIQTPVTLIDTPQIEYTLNKNMYNLEETSEVVNTPQIEYTLNKNIYNLEEASEVINTPPIEYTLNKNVYNPDETCDVVNTPPIEYTLNKNVYNPDETGDVVNTPPMEYTLNKNVYNPEETGAVIKRPTFTSSSSRPTMTNSNSIQQRRDLYYLMQQKPVAIITRLTDDQCHSILSRVLVFSNLTRKRGDSHSVNQKKIEESNSLMLQLLRSHPNIIKVYEGDGVPSDPFELAIAYSKLRDFLNK